MKRRLLLLSVVVAAFAGVLGTSPAAAATAPPKVSVTKVKASPGRQSLPDHGRLLPPS